MSNKKQSSVDWFYDNIITHCIFDQLRQMITINPDVYLELKNKAKAMHKEEIKSAFNRGELFASDYYYGNDDDETDENYYNETFGGGE